MEYVFPTGRISTAVESAPTFFGGYRLGPDSPLRNWLLVRGRNAYHRLYDRSPTSLTANRNTALIPSNTMLMMIADGRSPLPYRS